MSAPPATPGRTPVRRSYQKCDQCRRKKIKCTPIERDFDSGKKCDACISAGEPCSANTRVPRRSVQSPAAGSTPLNNLSPNVSFTNFFDAEIPQLGFNDLRIQSPTQSLDSIVSPASSQISTYESEPWRPEESPFLRARGQLQEMGLSVELYEYCQHRKRALTLMTQALSLLNLSQAISSLDVLLQSIFMSILSTLRNTLQIVQRPSQLSTTEIELLSRRALDTGYRLLRCGGHVQLGPDSSFNQMLNTIRDDLVRLYVSQQDHAEANRLRTMPTDPGRFLEGLTYDILPSLSISLSKAMDLVVRDVPDTSRKGLDLTPGRPPRITTTHLALLSDRLHRTVDPDTIGLDMACDMTKRNALHLAAERGDVSYVRTWCKAAQTDDQLSQIKNARDIFGLTPLMIAAYQGSADVFRLLLDAGADPKLQTVTSKSLLSLAAMAGNETIVSEILDRGISIQDHLAYCSPIHDAAASGRSEEVIHLLLQHKAEPRNEHPAYGNKRASKVAKDHDHRKIAQILSDAEKKLDAMLPIRDDQGQILRDLQQKITNHIARSNSPSSPSSSVRTSRRSPSTERSRPVKRQRSLHCEWTSSPAMSSTSSTPRMQASNLAGPSPLVQVTTGAYNAPVGDLNEISDNSLEFFLNPGSDYSIYDLDAHCVNG